MTSPRSSPVHVVLTPARLPSQVHVRFDVVMRNFHTYGVDLAQAATATTAAGV